MRLLQIVPTLDPRSGGVANGVVELARAWTACGVHSEIVVVDARQRCVDAGVPVHVAAPAYGGYAFAPALARWLAGHVGRFDGLVQHGIWQYPGVAARRAALRCRKPYIVFPHGMLDPWFKRTYPAKHIKKTLYWRCGQYPVLRDARAVCFTCDEERSAARTSFWPNTWREETVGFGSASPPGAVADAFVRAHPALAGRRFALFLGRLHEKKGCDLLLDAFAQACRDDATLDLVMAGPDQTGWLAALRERAVAAGIAQRVHWTGHLEGDVKWGALQAAEVFILPSHQENFGVVVAEALACGTPVLVSDKVNIWREVDSDGVGFVAPDTLDGTVALLRRWRATPEHERDAMRRRARASHAQRYAMPAVAQRVFALFAAVAP